MEARSLPAPGPKEGSALKTNVDLRIGRITRFASLAASLALAAGCSSSSLRQVDLYKSGRDMVSLQYQIRNGKAAPQGYAHPGTLTEGQVDRILAAIGVEEYSFFSWRSQGPLFTDDDRARLAPWIADALRKATPDQWVRFSVSGTKKFLVLTTPHLSDGICFVKDGKFHLVLGNINFEVLESTDRKAEPYGLDPRDRIDFPHERLTVLAGVGVGAGAAPPPVIPGDRWLGQERRNWLVFDLHRNADATPSPTIDSPRPSSGDAAERLKRLKDLREQGLITAEEYEKKRLEIVQGL